MLATPRATHGSGALSELSEGMANPSEFSFCHQGRGAIAFPTGEEALLPLLFPSVHNARKSFFIGDQEPQLLTNF